MGKELICDASIVSSLMAQRLVKKLCNHCCEPLENHMERVDPKLLERLKRTLNNDLSGIMLRNENGCVHCHAGNAGRTVVAEIINTDQLFMDHILASNYEAEKYWLEELNGIPMMAHGLIKVKRGEVDPLDLEDELEFIKLPELFNKKNFLELLNGTK